jgi:hypothetical protein
MLPSQRTARPHRIEDLLDARLMARLDKFDVRTQKVFPGKLLGERRSKRRGQSVEFEDFRNYVPGDDLRHIDWNVYARLDRLFVKVFLEEEDLSVQIALDASASMDTGTPNKLAFAAQLAMALGYIGLVKNNRVGLTIFGKPGGWGEDGKGWVHLPEQRGRQKVQRVGRFLLDQAWGERTSGTIATGRPGIDGDVSGALTAIARTRIGKGVMIILSDFLAEDGYQRGLKALAAAGGYDTYCLQILSPGELEPEKEAGGIIAGDLRLTDVESGRAAEVTVTAPIIKRYKERLAAYVEGLNRFCLAHEMNHSMVRTDVRVETLVFETLRKRGVIG